MISSVVQSELIYVFYSYVSVFSSFPQIVAHHTVYHCSFYSLSTLEHVQTLMCG